MAAGGQFGSVPWNLHFRKKKKQQNGGAGSCVLGWGAFDTSEQQ